MYLLIVRLQSNRERAVIPWLTKIYYLGNFFHKERYEYYEDYISIKFHLELFSADGNLIMGKEKSDLLSEPDLNLLA